MKAVFNYELQDWNNIEVLQRNRLCTRPFYTGYADRESAAAMHREKSGNYKLLNGSWDFTYYENPLETPEDFMKPEFDSSGWGKMPVPGHWQLNGFGYPHYNDAISLFPILERPAVQNDNPTGAYRHFFRVEKDEEKEYLLRFDGVESAYHVWLNGTFVGYSQGSRLSAEFDVTDCLRSGENLLAVKVYKFCEGSYLENQDMWWFSGIIRDVALLARPRVHLADYQLDCGLTEDGEKGILNASFCVENGDGKEKELILAIRLFREETAVLCRELKLCAAPGEKRELKLEEKIEEIRQWSAEQPFLYRMEMVLKDAQEERIVEVYAEEVGFRRVELKNGRMLVNGKPVKFKGVNRHDWNESSGRCITLEDMRRDLVLMKENNINAIRTSHYPPHPDFLSLCDRMGFYVMEEADLECNQMTYIKGKMNRLSEDVLWEASYLDRVERMVRRDKNHPCVLVWSLGNESGFGSNFVTAGRFVKEYDPSRLIHYEEDRDASIADMYSTMYTSHQELERLGRDTSKRKPHIVCEYAHAMGNGPGGLKEYWEIFDKYERLQGGFIWEWVDHGLKRRDDKGVTYFTYGGDYGDYPNSGAFCCDGLVQADRRPTPALSQVKKALEPVRCFGFSAGKGTISIRNRYDFQTLSHLKCICTLESCGSVRWEKEVPIDGIAPQSEQEIKLFEKGEIPGGDGLPEAWICLRFIYRENPRWYQGSGPLEAAVHQERLVQAAEVDNILPKDMAADLSAVTKVQESTQGTLSGEMKNGRLYLQGRDFSLEFDCIHGWLDGYTFRGEKLLCRGLGFNFWRAPVDNDKNMEKMWEDYRADCMCNVVETIEADWDEKKAVIRCRQTYAPIVMEWKILLDSTYTIDSEGKVTIEVNGNPVGMLPECLPRIGLRFLLNDPCENAQWYGRGPLETYPDCKEGNRVGRYRADADAFYFPYVVPQENGNREDTRFAVFEGNNNALDLAGESPFSFSILHYSQEELTRAAHTCELHRENKVYLQADYAQNGLGSASWGPEALPQYRLRPLPFHLKWQLGAAGRGSVWEQARGAWKALAESRAVKSNE